MLVTEQDMPSAMVAAIISRFIVSHTMNENALLLSEHPHGNITSHLGQLWHQLLPTEHEAKITLLHAQRDIYTFIKNSSDHTFWRSKMRADMYGCIAPQSFRPAESPSPSTRASTRHKRPQDLCIKGYRIIFRLRMAPVRWDIE
nr:hypothetical protein DE146DRAFT_417482 [Phaeosphaeria sp. MPI-PUGE-AT-0046c]